MTPDSASLLPVVWLELAAAVASPGHPWRTPVLVTGGSYPDGRVVVLRRFQREPDRLTFFTDARSPKASALREEPRVSWVFYHPERRLQVRARARATFEPDPAIVAAAWQALPEASRREYATATAPGSVWQGDDWLPESAAARNFAIVVTEVASWDCLQLGRDGHRREGCSPRGVERWVP